MSTSEVLGESATIAAINAWNGAVVYTIGHSTRPQAELVDLLHHYKVTTLADVRTVPRSRHNPQFNRDELITALPEVGIAYVHLAALGGLRRGLGDASPNKGWRNQSFRGYADYMQSPEFAAGLEELRSLTKSGPVAVMCAEAVPWRCHRSMIGDALLIRGILVEDIIGSKERKPHVLTAFARVAGRQITYPVPADTAEHGSPVGKDK